MIIHEGDLPEPGDQVIYRGKPLDVVRTGVAERNTRGWHLVRIILHLESREDQGDDK